MPKKSVFISLCKWRTDALSEKKIENLFANFFKCHIDRKHLKISQN